MAAVLKKNEEVLTEDDPRNILNGGGGGGVKLKVVNAIDAADVVSQGLSTRPGEQAFLNLIRTNRTAIRQVLN